MRILRKIIHPWGDRQHPEFSIDKAVCVKTNDEFLRLQRSVSRSNLSKLSTKSAPRSRFWFIYFTAGW